MDKVKIIAFYLPQFHSIKENSEWWGEDFTEWVNVKKAMPLYDWHVQPKVPLDNNYYDLLNDDTKLWQIKLAKEHGVYGFCYYHYWFGGKMLLEKPMEQMLNNKSINFPFCICWANATWTKEWVGDSKKVLINQTYGDEKEWKLHYDYLKKFFHDERYIKKNGKPLFVIYNPLDIIDCKKMIQFLDSLAKEDGFDGLCFVSQMLCSSGDYKLCEMFEHNIEFQPSYALMKHDKMRHPFLRKVKRILVKCLGKPFKRIFHIDLQGINGQKKARVVDYDDIWSDILNMKPKVNGAIPGAFAKWDNTPRKGERGIIYKGSSPIKFEQYLKKQIKRARDIYNSEFLFLYAWNEWAEGGYIEPDTQDGYGYLEAIKNALEE